MKELIGITLLCLTFWACTDKAGTGGDKKIYGTVNHHTTPILDATVYLKYKAKELPSEDVSDYDEQMKLDENGSYEFNSLKQGNYYLFCLGYDSTIIQNVKGGLRVKLSKSDKEVEKIIPVTEGH